MLVRNDKAWDYAIVMLKADSLELTPEMMEMIEKERTGTGLFPFEIPLPKSFLNRFMDCLRPIFSLPQYFFIIHTDFHFYHDIKLIMMGRGYLSRKKVT